jgi:hypothetical protein
MGKHHHHHHQPEGDSTTTGQPQATEAQGDHPVFEPLDANRLRVFITGICAIVHEPQDQELIVIMPRATERRASSDGEIIPEHDAWLVARSAQVVPDDSREEDFKVTGIDNTQFSVFLLRRERLTVSTGEAQTILSNPFTDPEAVRLMDVCAHTKIDPHHVDAGGSDKISAQIALPAVELTQAARTPLAFEFQPDCPDLSTHPPRQRISHVGRVDLVTGVNPITFSSRPFDGLEPLDPIVIQPDPAGTVVLIGHTPLSGVQAYMAGEGHDNHLGRDVHFELFYELAATMPLHPLTAPFGFPMGVSGPLPKLGNCPYGIVEKA